MTLAKKASIQKMFLESSNKTKTASHFGISARTVGRIVAELPIAPVAKEEVSVPVDSRIEEIKAELDALKELLKQSLEKPVASVVYIRHRQLPDMDLLSLKSYRVQSNDYPNPYRNTGSECIDVYGIPTRYSSFNGFLITADFKLRHPVSPACKVFPYMATENSLPEDPPIGKHCDCNDCNQWRYLLGKQKNIELARESSAGDWAAFHAWKLRN